MGFVSRRKDFSFQKLTHLFGVSYATIMFYFTKRKSIDGGRKMKGLILVSVICWTLGLLLGVAGTVTTVVLYQYKHVSPEQLCKRTCYRTVTIDREIKRMLGID